MDQIKPYLTKTNIAAVLIIAAGIVAYATGNLDLAGFVTLVNGNLS